MYTALWGFARRCSCTWRSFDHIVIAEEEFNCLLNSQITILYRTYDSRTRRFHIGSWEAPARPPPDRPRIVEYYYSTYTYIGI